MLSRENLLSYLKAFGVKIHVKMSRKCLVYAGFFGFTNDCACRLALELASNPLVLYIVLFPEGLHTQARE